VLLSLKAGLRAAEIANLSWDMVVDPTGEIATTLELRDYVAKNGSGRVIPVHPDLREALMQLRSDHSGTSGAVIASERGGPMRPIAIVCWFARAYRAIGLTGCSSHSGRRTFITRCREGNHQDTSHNREQNKMGGVRQGERRQRVDAERKDEAPPAEVERHAFSEITRSL
jgi:integrase